MCFHNIPFSEFLPEENKNVVSKRAFMFYNFVTLSARAQGSTEEDPRPRSGRRSLLAFNSVVMSKNKNIC